MLRKAKDNDLTIWNGFLSSFAAAVHCLHLTCKTRIGENPKWGEGTHSFRLLWGRSVNTVAECTVPEKILLAASHLEEQGQSPFSAEALIVAAWQKFPRTFGLKGYEEQYPDSNKVLAGMMGEKGLPGRGWMVKVGQRLYALTRDGRQVVRK